jgi:esterase/lipase superfamily enzyme
MLNYNQGRIAFYLITFVITTLCATGILAAKSVNDNSEQNDTATNSQENITVSFATVRNRTESTSPARYFGGTRGQLRTGLCTVAFSPIKHLEGIAQAVPFYIPNERIKLTEVDEIPIERLFNEISEFSKHDNGNSVVYIHGYSVDFERSCWRSAIFQRALGLDDRLLLFSWPADGNMLKYTWDESDLAWSVTYFTSILDEIVKRAGKRKVDVVAHSLGARGAVQALARMAYRKTEEPIINELILIAPDIDTEIFRQELPLLQKAADRITVYVSQNDKPLKLSHEMHGYPRLGMAGEHLTIMEGVEIIDISAISTRRLSGHIYHLFTQKVIEDLTLLLHTGEPAGLRPGLQKKYQNGLPYWRMKQ